MPKISCALPNLFAEGRRYAVAVRPCSLRVWLLKRLRDFLRNLPDPIGNSQNPKNVRRQLGNSIPALLLAVPPGQRGRIWPRQSTMAAIPAPGSLERCLAVEKDL
jgi:hypothetical protein